MQEHHQVETSHLISDLRRVAPIALIGLLPFVSSEIVNNAITRQSVPGLIALFGFLWLLGMTGGVLIISLFRSVRIGKSLRRNPITFFSKLALLILVSVLWVGLVSDQLPCFLGIPNCD